MSKTNSIRKCGRKKHASPSYPACDLGLSPEATLVAVAEAPSSYLLKSRKRGDSLITSG
ncbi:hypothetical protein BaRGS_00039974, partial [Batillaria attramentaria]